MTTSRATIVSARTPFDGEEAARRWLRQAGEPELAEDLSVLDRALHAFRVAVSDPHAPAVGREQLLVARIGYGEGEQVADGRWSDARELLPGSGGPGRARRSRALEPQARLAAVLAGREPLLQCQELALRARVDIDGGRLEQAALQLSVALAAALAELPRDPSARELAARIDELRDLEPAVAAAARAALAAPLPADERPTVETALRRLEAALRARAVAGT